MRAKSKLNVLILNALFLLFCNKTLIWSLKFLLFAKICQNYGKMKEKSYFMSLNTVMILDIAFVAVSMFMYKGPY